MREHQPLVTTLDVNMPGMDGFETAKRIRSVSTTYIVMLSARTEEIDALQGLEAGADDYVAKPFRPRELRARIDAMLRRPRHHVAVPPLRRGPSRADRSTTSAWVEHPGVRPQSRRCGSSRWTGWISSWHAQRVRHPGGSAGAGRRVRGKSDLALMLRGEQFTGSST